LLLLLFSIIYYLVLLLLLLLLFIITFVVIELPRVIENCKIYGPPYFDFQNKNNNECNQMNIFRFLNLVETDSLIVKLAENPIKLLEEIFSNKNNNKFINDDYNDIKNKVVKDSELIFNLLLVTSMKEKK
jgi:hypothetical protein